MEVKATAKFSKISAQKARLVANLIRGMQAQEASEQLQFLPQKAAKLILKVLNSAIANATNNFELSKEGLVLKTITVNEGPRAYRWMPKAFGRATPIKKQTAHIEIILESPETAKSRKHEAGKAESRDKVKHEVEGEKLADQNVSGVPLDSKEPENFDVHSVGKHRRSQNKNAKGKGFIKKLFNRKAV